MEIGQRINLIKKIARRMSEADFSDGDLVLRQFQLPTSNEWGGSGGYEYFMQMIERATIQVLIQLHEYLFPDEVLPAGNVKTKTNWSAGTLRLFLSHSSTKKLQVTQVKNELKKFGIECFVAHEDIEPTVEWLREIQVALGSSHALVAFLCNEFRKSSFCDQEVGFAIQRGILTVPVRLEIDPYGFMGPLQGVTAFSSDPEQIAKDIYTILEKNVTTKNLVLAAKEKYLEDLVERFINSSNFSDSTEYLRQIEQYPYKTIPPMQLLIISQNWEANPQVRGCNGVRKRIGNLFFKHDFKENKTILPF